MFTEKEISQINKSLENQEFETQVGLYPDSVDTHTLTFSFEVVGTRKMISVGEYFDYAFYDITILDVSETLKKYLSIVLEIFYQNKLEGTMKERLEYWFKKDSYILREVNGEIDEKNFKIYCIMVWSMQIISNEFRNCQLGITN